MGSNPIIRPAFLLRSGRPGPPPVNDARGPVSTHALAAAGAIAGLAQLIATVGLGMSSPTRLHQAALAGPRLYILFVVLLAAGGGLAWYLRRPALSLAAALPATAGVLAR